MDPGDGVTYTSSPFIPFLQRCHSRQSLIPWPLRTLPPSFLPSSYPFYSSDQVDKATSTPPQDTVTILESVVISYGWLPPLEAKEFPGKQLLYSYTPLLYNPIATVLHTTTTRVEPNNNAVLQLDLLGPPFQRCHFRQKKFVLAANTLPPSSFFLPWTI